MQLSKTYQILTNLNCNLACTYCYEDKYEAINSDVDIDLYLRSMFERDKDSTGDVIIELIGGESLLYPELVDFIIKRGSEYAKAYQVKVRFSISTNGTLLTKPKVQNILLPYKHLLSIGISIDGIQKNHDACRVYANGKGTYVDVVRGLKWLRDTWCPNGWGVKATFTKDTLKYYAESIANIYALGAKDIGANLIFEDAADYLICLDQFKQVADFLLQNPDCKVHQFSKESVAMAGITDKKVERNYCGTTKYMSCLGFNGFIYGCNRFCTMNKPDKAIGKLVENSIEWFNTPFIIEVINQHAQLPQHCLDCELHFMCPMCIAAPYNEEKSVTEYYNEKRMCNWTYALATTHLYLKGLLYHKGQ